MCVGKATRSPFELLDETFDLAHNIYIQNFKLANYETQHVQQGIACCILNDDDKSYGSNTIIARRRACTT